MTSSKLVLTLVSLFGLQACTHMIYTRGAMSTKAVSVDPNRSPEGTPFDFSQNHADVSTNEIALLDSTGSLCASLMTGLNQAAAAEGRRKEAARNREFGVLNYKYKVSSPGDFGGYPCGVFYKWGTPTSMTGFGIRGAPIEPVFGEGGFMLSGWDEMFENALPGLYFGGGTRPSIGVYSGKDRVGSSDVFMRIPVTFGFMVSPEWAWGLAAKATAGVELVSLALSWKADPFRDSKLMPFDYAAGIAWTLPVFKYGSVTAEFGWAKEVAIRYDDLLLIQGQWQGKLGLVLDYDTIFD